MLSWLKRSKSIEPTEMKKPTETAPFEILLPEEVMRNGVPDLRIASKFLALLVESNLPDQHLEIFDGMPLVNSPSQPVKHFLTVVNGAKQLKVFLAQVEAMLFHGEGQASKGSLCCLVNGIFTEFEIAERGRNATINWQITRHIRPAT